MADIRIKDLPTTATQTASDDFIALDGTVNGTRKIDASAPSFKTSVTSPSVVAPATTDLTLTGGSTGASLVLGQGAGASGVFNNGVVIGGGALSSTERLMVRRNTAGYTLLNTDGTTIGGFYVGSGLWMGTTTAHPLEFFTNGSASQARLTTTGNLLIGGTTDIIGSGGLKVFGTTAASSTGSGALQVAGGGYFGAASLFGANVGIGASANQAAWGASKRVATVWGSGANQEGVVEIGVPSATASNKIGRLAFVNGTGFYYSGIAGYRDAADNTTGLAFETYSNGTLVTPLTISGAGAATFAGAVTVSGAGTSSVAGGLSVGSASGSTGQNAITFPKIAGGSYADGFYLYSGNTDHGFGFSLYDLTASAWRWTVTNGGNFLLGTTIDSANGKLQLATHTTSAGGIGFGTDIAMFRDTAGGLQQAYSAGTTTRYRLVNNTGNASVFSRTGTTTTISSDDGSVVLASNNITALTLDSSQNATFAGTVKTKGSTLSAINETNVSTTATDIAVATTSVGGLYFVTGYNTSGGAQGTWLLMARGANVTTISSDNNTTLTVTYSMSAGKLQAATASGTIALIATAITR